MIIYCRYGAPYLSPCPGFDLSLPFLPRSISSSTAWGWPWSTPSRSRWGTSPPPRLYLGQPIITERRGSFSDGPTLFLVVSEQCLQGTRGHLHRLQSVHPCWPVTTILKEGRIVASNFLWLGCGDHKISPKSPVWEGLAELIIILSWWSSYHFNITFCFTISKLVTLATFPPVWLLLNREIIKRPQLNMKSFGQKVQLFVRFPHSFVLSRCFPSTYNKDALHLVVFIFFFGQIRLTRGELVS